MAEKLVLSDRTHPLYEDNKDFWELYYSAAQGGDKFITSDNLFSHRLEDSEDYEERLERAYYLNFCETIPSIYNSFIFKESIERPPDANLDMFRRNCDGQGTSITDFIIKAGFLSKVFGAVHALVDVPTSPKKKLSKREAKVANIYPFCQLITPLQLVDWSLDSDGNFNWVIIKSVFYRDSDPTIEREEEEHYKLISKTEWRIEDKDGNEVKYEKDDGRKSSGPNPLGFVPIVTLYHKTWENNRIGESLLKDIVYINRTIFNWCSCIDEQVERQTFSQLVVPDDGSLAEASETGDDPLQKIGTSSIWTFNADAGFPPQFISPDVNNIKTIWALTIDHIKEMFRLAGLIGSSDDMYVSRSGRAAQMGFLGVNSALADTAKKYQNFENELARLAYIQLNANPEEYDEVKYPDSFDISSLSDEIDAYLKVMERNFSTRMNKEIMKTMSRRAVPLVSQVIRSEIEDEIESSSGRVDPIRSSSLYGKSGQQEQSGEDGNPNSNSGKTFRTKNDKETEEVGHRKAK